MFVIIINISAGWSEQPGLLRITEQHFPEYVPPTEKKLAPTRRCVICSKEKDGNEKKKRRESRYYCRLCNVGLCVVPCFKTYHTQTNL